MPYLYLTLAILAEVIGTSALKTSDGFTRPTPSLVVLIGYGVAFYFLSLSLQSLAVGVAYAIWSGTGVALITLIGWRVFKQRLDAPAILGIVDGATGTTALAASAGFTRAGHVAVMVLGYLTCFIALTRALRVIPISVAYAVWSGVGIALVSGIGWFWLGQQLNRGELTGIALILVGSVVIQLFSRSADTSR